MSLSGIFDPIVRSHFANKYANAGGNTGGALDTGLCVSTKNTFVLEWKGDTTGLEPIASSDGHILYKVAEASPFFDTPFAVLQVNLAELNPKNPDDGLTQTGRLTVGSGTGIGAFDTFFNYESQAFIQGIHSPGETFFAQVAFPNTGDSLFLLHFATSEIASQAGAPSAGVYCETLEENAYFRRIILEKLINIE